MGTWRIAVAPSGILNWADGRCLKADFYIHFNLGGMNSASNTHFLRMKICFASLRPFEIFFSMWSSQRFLFNLDQVIVFLFSKSPYRLPLKGVCDSLDTLQLKAIWSVSPRTCRHIQRNVGSRGEYSKLKLVSTVRNVWSDATPLHQHTHTNEQSHLHLHHHHYPWQYPNTMLVWWSVWANRWNVQPTGSLELYG